MYYTTKSVYEYISQQNQDPIREWKICRISGQEFAVTQSDLDFYKKVSPLFAGQKAIIPTPTLCPEERQRRRLMFRNERKLYKRKCDATGELIVSTFSPDKPHKVYHSSYRRSDKWSPLDYGREFNFNKNFTENFRELFLETPLLALYQLENENCEYTHSSAYSKNCYFCFVCVRNEDCLYSNTINNSNNIVDGAMIFASEYCYDSIDCDKCFQCYHCNDMESCKNCYNCISCINCDHCIGCSNLNGGSYMINNKKVTKEEFEHAKKEKVEKIQQSFAGNKISGCEQVTGNFLYNCQNTHYSFDLKNSVDSKYCIYGNGAKDSQDLYAIYPETELCYNCIPIGFGAYNVTNSFFVYSSKNTHYSVMCRDCEDCFGCISLRNKQYCIFNKQYPSKEAYEQEVTKIITHMTTTGERGEFFDPSLSPFGYNETVAQEYFPLSSDEAMNFPSGQGRPERSTLGVGVRGGLNRQDKKYDPQIPVGADIVDRKTNPDLSGFSDESLLSKIYICEVTGRPFRIIKPELEFYHKHHLLLPHLHPDQRHIDRMNLRVSRELHLRTCDKTGELIASVYPQDVPFKVYSEEAYKQEVFG